MTNRPAPPTPPEWVIQRLLIRWAEADLLGSALDYPDQLRTLTALLAATDGSLHQTATIFDAVLQQAVDASYSAAWVQKELAFETYVESVGGEQRAGLALFELGQEGTPTDAQLDLYNERLARFGSTTTNQ